MKRAKHRRGDPPRERTSRAAWVGGALVLGTIFLLGMWDPHGQAAPPVSRATPRSAADLAIDPQLLEKLSKSGELTLKNSTLAEALFSISETWKINLVVGEDVQGVVNGVFKDAPLHEILDAILLSNGYSYRPVGQSLVVMKLKDLGDINPLFETTTIPIENSKPEEILAGIKLLSSPQGKIQTIASAKSIMVIDFPDRVSLIRAYAQKLDDAALGSGDPAGGGEGGGRLQVAYFRPEFVNAAYLKEPIAAVLSKEGKVAIMELDNRVVVVDYPSQLRLAQQTIKQLDIPRPQVRITAMIYDLSIEDVLSLGINWNNAFKGRPDALGNSQSLFSVDSLTSVPAPPGTVSGAITFMNLSRNFDVTAVINALQKCKNSRLLADPNVTVIDNEPATMSIVTEIPYQQLTQTAQGGNIGTTSFREAGVKLIVTPRIAQDGTIKLECTPSFSRLTGFTPGDSPQPIIDRREAKTTVRAADRQTIVIGGLRTRTDIKERKGVVGLQDLPLGIGYLFRHKDVTSQESELVVFLTPEIIAPLTPNKPREDMAQGTVDCWLDKVPPGQGCGGADEGCDFGLGCKGMKLRKGCPDPQFSPGPNTNGYSEEIPKPAKNDGTPADSGGTKAAPPANDAPLPPAPALNAPHNASAPASVTPAAPLSPSGLRQPNGYTSRQPTSTGKYQPPQPPVVAQSGPYQPQYAQPTTPPQQAAMQKPQVAPQPQQVAQPTRPAPAPCASSNLFGPPQLTTQTPGFEPLPSIDVITPADASRRPPASDAARTATRPADSRGLDAPNTDSRGFFR